MSDQLEVVLVPSREILAVKSISSRTQRDEEERRALLRHGLIDAVSTKSPADRSLFFGQLAAVLVPSREQLAVGSIPSRTERDEKERRARFVMAPSTSTKSPANRTPFHNQLEVVSRAAKTVPLRRSQVEQNGKKKKTVSGFVVTPLAPCRRSHQLIEPYWAISLKRLRSWVENKFPLNRSQVKHNGTKKSIVPSFFMTSSTPCRRSRQLP